MAKRTSDKIQDLYRLCIDASGTVDFRSICKHFWFILENSLTFLDLAGVFSLATSGSKTEVLDASLFLQFLNAIAKIRFPSSDNSTENLIDRILTTRGLKITNETNFYKIMDKSVMKVLLKFDLSLRKIFSSFAGKNIRLGAGLTWNEVKNQSIGMEIDGFLAFAGAYSIVPTYFNLSKCEKMARDVITQYPIATSSMSSSQLFYPQFQLLLCILALECSAEPMMTSSSKNSTQFAKRIGPEIKENADIISDFLKNIRIDRTNSNSNNGISATDTDIASSPNGAASHRLATTAGSGPVERSSFMDQNTFDNNSNYNTINEVDPHLVFTSNNNSQSQFIDQYNGASANQSRFAMMMRIDQLFDDVERLVLESNKAAIDASFQAFSSSSSTGFDERTGGDTQSAAGKMSGKPVVISDTLPVPKNCPEIIEQLLQAALAHHNLGNYEEALNFLEASKMQMSVLGLLRTGTDNNNAGIAASSEAFDLELYITLCRGNIYQSSGDDEQSLSTYMEGLSTARKAKDRDWESICLNCIGVLAYYSVRYEVALLCFCVVSKYREQEYGHDSADTATAWNNEGCALYCMSKRGESRLKFEKSWNIICKVVGHRSPRAVTVWKNLEKSRRFLSTLKSQTGASDTLNLRADVDKLLVGGRFIIKAISTQGVVGKKKKSKYLM